MEDVKDFLEKNSLEDIQKSNKIIEYKFLKSLFEADKLYLKNIKLDENIFKDLVNILSVVNEVLPGKWDLNFRLNFNKDVKISSLKLFFKEVTISNETYRTHTIKDLFVYIPFDINNNGVVSLRELRGFRNYYKFSELSSNYNHSHLTFNDYNIKDYILRGNKEDLEYFEKHYPAIGDFCLGYGPIIETIAEINSFIRNNNEEQYKRLMYKFFIEVISYVSWESERGGAYRYFSNINRNEFASGRRFYYYDRRVIDTIDYILKHYWYKNIDRLQLNVTTSNDGFLSVIGLGNFYNIFKDTDNNEIQSLESNVYCIKVANNSNYYTIGSVTLNSNLQGITKFKVGTYFRGEFLEFNLENDLQNNSDIEITIHPEVEKKTLEVLTRYINNGIYFKNKQTGKN